MAPPADDGGLGIIVIGVIIYRNMNGKSLVFVPEVFLFQGVRVVFGVAGDEDLASLLVHDSVDPRFRGGGQDFQPRHLLNVLPVNGGVAGMGNPEFIIKAPE